MCKEQKSGAWGAVECAMDVLTTFWYKNQSKCMYNSAYHINDDNWSIRVVLRCSWVPEYSEFWLSSIPTASGVLILDWVNSHNLQWFWHRIVILPTASWIFCCPPEAQKLVVNAIHHTIYWVSGLSGGWYYWFNPATASTWEFNSTTATISQEKQLEKWVFILYV